MSETLQWHLKLREDVSAPAKRAATGVRQYDAAMRKAAASDARGQRQLAQAAAARARLNSAAARRDQALAIASHRRVVRQESAIATARARINAQAFRRDQALALANHRALVRQDTRTRVALERSTATNARNLRRSQDGVRSSLGEMVGTLGGLGLAGGAAVLGLVSSFASVGASAAAAVVRIAAFRESSLTALEAVLGSSEAAGRQFRNAITIANQTPLDTQDIIAQTQSFAIAGFAEREIQPLVAASADLGAAFGQRSSEGFSYALAQIRAAGQLQGQELLQLQNANVSREAVLASIARQLNLQGATPEARNRAALEAIRGRRVSSGVGIQAALDAVSTRLDRGGALGGFARRQSETLTGAISNARNAMFNLLVGIDFSKIPGLNSFRQAILSVTEALSGSGRGGKTLRGFIEGAANVAGRLFAMFNARNIGAAFTVVEGAFQGIQRFATAAWPVVRAFVTGVGPGFMAGVAPLRALLGTLLSGGGPSATTMQIITRAALGLGEAIGFAAGAAVTAVGGIATFFTFVSTIGATALGLITSVLFPLRTAFASVGGAIVGGITDGINGAIGTLHTTIAGVGAGAVQAARDALGIHSPSTVFRDAIGRQIPAGMELGIRAGASPVHDAVAGLASPQSMQLGGLGGGINLTVYVTVNEARNALESGRAVVAEFEDQLADIFNRMAEQHA